MGAQQRQVFRAATALLMLGCHSQSTALPGQDAGPEDSGGEVGEVSLGLASRPPNPSCRAPARPVPAGLEGLPLLLSATGCFDSGDPTRPLPALIPYAVNAPLWSDGAEKDRWLALPDGALIHLGDDGDFTMPPGAVLIKTFRFGARRVETRFFVHHPGGEWSGYTYEWNETGTDATLLDEGSHRRQIGDRDWHFPSRAECDTCHTAGAGHSLGLEVAQLNRGFVYDGGTTANQLATFAHIGVFDAPLPDDPDRLPALPSPVDGGGPIETRARAYLHANCSNCHRPEIGNSGSTDLRFSTPLAATQACNAAPLKGTLGYGVTVKLISPGKPDESMVLLRMRALDSTRMPSVASLAVDEEGVALLSSWIGSLAACP